jgi:hypothetical protein
MLKKGFAPLSLGVMCVALAGCNPSEPAPAASTEAPAVPAAPAASVGDAAAAAATNFETWIPIANVVVHNAAADAPDGSKNADTFDAKPGDGVAVLDQSPLKAGEIVTAKVFLWGPENQAVGLQLVRWCSNTPSEVETVQAQLTPTPTEFTVSHTFTNAHDCLRFQMISTGIAGSFNAWNPRIARTPPSQP